MIARIVILSATLLIAAACIARAVQTEAVPVRESFEGFPMTLDTWQGRPAETFDAKTLAVLGVEEYLNRTYSRPSDVPVGLYIGYYESQREGDTIHSPLNCLPGAGWEPLAKSTLVIPVYDPTLSPPVAGGATPRWDITVNRYVIRKGLDRMMVLYWYQSHGRVVASEYWGKVHMVVDAVRLNRTDAALVRVITPVEDTGPAAEARAEQRAVAFVQRMFPRLGQYLPD
jgi:EpsI family protein